MTELETKMEASRNLASVLRELQENVTTVNTVVVPPIWSGLVQDLDGFTKALQEYVDDPILDGARRNVRQLAEFAGQNRIPPSLSKEFLLDNSDELERAKSALERIGNPNLRERAGDHVLTVIGVDGTKKAIDAAIQEIDEYFGKATELEKNIGDYQNLSPLLEKAKEHVLSELANPKSFNVAEIEVVNTKWTQAGNADTMGNNLDLKSELLHDHFQEHESIESLVRILDDVRVLVNDTSFVTKIPKGVHKSPTDFASSRSEALRSANLEILKASLNSVSESAKTWLKELVGHVDKAITQVDSVMGYIELTPSLRSAVAKIKSSAIAASNTMDPKLVFECYVEAERLGRRARTEADKKHKLSEMQRSILSNPEQLATLRIENPDGFWSDMRGIVESGLAEINLVGKRAQDG